MSSLRPLDSATFRKLGPREKGQTERYRRRVERKQPVLGTEQ
ncbi:hypothetical protein HMPREF1705_04764 [Acetomicrobium hydrogeniformans ATCC BAA-1850]|uniref:Uncharacterized protein n=1 Tax=Acetomicrobium hydrogeniformans ATCC BAA-1850 TaxID=592015 RepID=A0A0T5XB79_9BACT|nr:hypothetical protein HMPREF1705_04764 [Acetomicrobium hydrogeniformans ATCC BAA-1850]